MDWSEEFRSCLAEAFDWSAPSSPPELEERLNLDSRRPKVPDVLWAYACGHRDLAAEYDQDDSPWQRLRAELNHQGSVTPETALAIPFVLRLARHLPDAPQYDLLADALWFGLGEQNFYLPWGYHQPAWVLALAKPLSQEEETRHQRVFERFGDDPYFQKACYQSLRQCSPTIREIGTSPTLSTQTMALWVLAFLPDEPENVAFLRAAWSSEDREVHRMALLSLAVMGVPLTSQERQELENNLTSQDNTLRLASALSLAIVQFRNEESPNDQVLEEICSAESEWEDVEDLIWIDSDEFVCSVLNEWEAKEPERVQAQRRI